MNQNQKRLFYLDVIRVASAILIVVYHFPLSIAQPVDFFHATVNGSWGMIPVYCFFMVSGAALMHRYGGVEHLDWKSFYRKRAAGIYPLFWIAWLFGFFAVFWQLGHFYDIPTPAFFWTLIGMDGWVVNWFPTFYTVGEWFLGSIIFLYLLFPVVRACWKKKPVLTMIVAAAAALALFWYHPFPMDIKQNPVVDLFYFLLGAGIEELRSKREQNNAAAESVSAPETARLPFGRLLGIGALAVMLVCLFVPFAKGLPTMELSYSAQAVGLGIFLRQSYIALTTLAVYLVLMNVTCALEQSTNIKKIILEISGKTYGIFLTHHVISQLLCNHFAAYELSAREKCGLLFLVFVCTWFMTLVIYRIEAYIKERF